MAAKEEKKKETVTLTCITECTRGAYHYKPGDKLEWPADEKTPEHFSAPETH